MPVILTDEAPGADERRISCFRRIRAKLGQKDRKARQQPRWLPALPRPSHPQARRRLVRTIGEARQVAERRGQDVLGG